jgi:sulfite reductase (ferredoxin)
MAANAQHVEQVKAEVDPLDIRDRLERYAREGFGSIDPDDLNIRFKWWGIYTQRASPTPGNQEGGEHLMLRTRIPGGILTSDQLEVVGRLATRYGRDIADITDRQNVQYHWLRIEDMPAIWDELGTVGLSSVQACGDTVRNILGCPVAGVDAEEVFDATPDLIAADQRMTWTKEFTNLPRKYKMSIAGCRDQCTQHEINDVSLVGVVNQADGRQGYDVFVGGGLSNTPHMAKRLGVFITRDEAVEVLCGITALFRDHGGRDKRTRARIKFLVAKWGIERFRQVLEADYLGRALPDGEPAPPSATVHRDHIGVHRQHDGRYYVGAAPLVGRTSGTALVEVARIARELGKGRARLTTQQRLLVLDIPEERVDEAVARLEALDLPVNPSPFWRGAIACTGIQFCKLALVATKQPAAELVRALEQRFPTFDGKVRINVNGCPNSCARYQIADIGLAGGESAGVGNYQLHLGGDLGEFRAFGHRVRERVPAAEIESTVGGLIDAYLSDRDGEESLQAWLRRQPEEVLAAAGHAPTEPVPLSGTP